VIPAPLVEVTRRDVTSGREVVESVHVGHLVAVDGDGTVVHAVGDPSAVVFPRSALKPLQAAACLDLLADATGDAGAGAGHGPFDLTDEEVAVAWGSHRAEPAQRAAVSALLARAGLTGDAAEEALTCPRARIPDARDAPAQRLAHNCSGKHALFRLTAHALGLPTDPAAILAHDGPLQSRVLAHVAEVTGPARAVGVDGCGAPALAMSLTVVARAFAALAAAPRFARVRDAGLAHPGLVAGHEPRDGGRVPLVDTALLAAGVVAKRGAEGVLAAGWRTPDGAIGGVAVKALDGSMRGAATALVAHLEGLGVVPAGEWREADPTGGGETAGTVRAADGVVTARA
jgi:L-asparaginase II